MLFRRLPQKIAWHASAKLFLLLLMQLFWLVSIPSAAALSGETANLLPTACHFTSDIRPSFGSMLRQAEAADCTTPAKRSSEIVWLSLNTNAVTPKPNTDYELAIFRHWTERIIVQFHYSDGYMQAYDAGPYDIDRYWSAGNFVAFTAPAREAPVAQILVGLQNPSSIKLFRQMVFVPSDDWRGEQSGARMLTFVITGVLLAMLFYNIVLATVLRFDFHFHYILVVFGAVAYNVSVYGFLSYLFPGFISHGAQMDISILALGLNGMAVLFFFCSFLEKRVLSEIWIAIARLLGVLFLAISIMYVIARGAYTDLLENWLQILSFGGVLFVFAALVQAFRKGSQAAVFFAIGWFLPIVGVVARNLREIGVIPHSDIVAYGVSVGIALETIIFAVGIAHRISKIREDRDQAKLASENAKAASQAKSDFLAHISHEIRNPMNAIIGLSDLAAQTNLTEKQRNYIHNIQTSGDVLMTLLNDTLDFSKIEAGQLALEQIPFAPKEVFDNMTAVVGGKAEEKGLAFSISGTDLLPDWLEGDPTRLSQILINLTNNAVKFTDEGGVAVDVNCDDIADGRLQLRCRVTDTGPGMTEEQVARLFQPFAQADASVSRRYGGTGLGLLICKQLVELMGGHVDVVSTEGSGSCFYFAVPFDQPDATDIEDKLSDGLARKVEQDLSLDDSVILIVEDNPINQLLLSRVLEKTGASFDMAGGGKEAVERAKHRQYDFILMDLNMPDMSGIEATQAIRQQETGKSLPIIAMTGSTDPDTWRECQQAGMSDYVSKPFKQSTLFETLRRWHGNSQQNAAE